MSPPIVSDKAICKAKVNHNNNVMALKESSRLIIPSKVRDSARIKLKAQMTADALTHHLHTTTAAATVTTSTHSQLTVRKTEATEAVVVRAVPLVSSIGNTLTLSTTTTAAATTHQAQVLPRVASGTADFTSILVSPSPARVQSPRQQQQQPQPLQPQNPPDVILQMNSLPDVVTNFLEQPTASALAAAAATTSPAAPTTKVVGQTTKSVIEPLTASFLFNGLTAKPVNATTMTHSNKTTEQQQTTELSHLADLESITDFLGMAAGNTRPLCNNNNVNNSRSSPHNNSTCTSDLDLMDSFESTKLDWESSSSGSGGSHFEFSCTQDVSDMLCDIGVNEPVDWGVDDIMIRI